MKAIDRRDWLAAVAAVGLTLGAQAAYEATIEAPNGVGDVVALTNALAEFNALSSRTSGRILLKPGVYNLRGVYMNSASHLTISAAQHGLFAGLGAKPEDTVLLGGGEAEAHRVLSLGGGGNYGWFTVSNMTVTGGWTSGDGGGISGNGTSRYSHLIISNNYAAGSNQGGGGGCMRGHAEYCLFADNRVVSSGTRFGGGLWTDGGGGQQATYVQGAWHCTFSNNVCHYAGGAMFLKGKCIDCTFVDNKANHGGAVHGSSTTYTWSGFSDTTEIRDCSFTGNMLSAWGHGSAIYGTASLGVPISNCVFTANDTPGIGGSGVIYKGNLADCVITNNLRIEQILYDCNLVRCLVANNTTTGNSAHNDYSSTAGAYTNVNCIFLNNFQQNYGHVTSKKVIVNCSYIGNISNNGGNYGGICTRCQMFNTLLFDNWTDGSKTSQYARDIRAHDTNGDLPLVMTNCLFATCDTNVTLDAAGFVTNDGVANTRKVADMKFEDAASGNYTPKYRSPASNAGCQEPWLIELAGLKDLAGNPRVYGDRIDIGAYECQKHAPGAVFTVR